MIYLLWAAFEIAMFGGSAFAYFGFDMNTFPALIAPIIMVVLGVIGLLPLIGDGIGDILEAIFS